MSIKIMSSVWDRGPSDKTEILVMLALADFCNDDGECWPSVASLAKKCRMTERGVQKVFGRLVATGWLEIDPRSARKNCNLYRVKTPEPGSPRTTFTPNTVPKTPEPGSPKPSRTVIAAAAAREAEITPDQLHAEVMAAVGLTSGHMPTHWMPPAAIIHCQRWVTDLGLTADQIIQAARESRKRHHDPPGGPRALDGVMQRLAATIQAPQLSPAQPNGATNARSERRAFDGAINALANQIADGTVRIDDTSRDPWHYAARGG